MLPAQPVPTSARSARSFPPRRAAGGAAPRPRAAAPVWGGRCRCRPATPRGQIGTRGSAAPGGRGLRERRGGPLRRRRSEAPRSQEAAAGGRCPSVVFDSPCDANRCAVLLYRARMARPAASSRKRLKYLLHSLLATFGFLFPSVVALRAHFSRQDVVSLGLPVCLKQRRLLLLRVPLVCFLPRFLPRAFPQDAPQNVPPCPGSCR